ncbi:MAG: hypothetical protein ABJQ23_20810 [Shimia thalassica]|uniref:hypothetical protein n=1 Tax=Shimia thalassica TaxID=1715693 RepID=UPI003296CA13
MASRTIYVHTGHAKTGTSYLQASLAISVDALASHGIAYPLSEAEIERVRTGGISSGNGMPDPNHLRTLIDRNDETLLISSEALFPRMQFEGLLEVMQEAAPEADFEMLLYVRDPMDHAVSKYQQQVKRGGSIQTFDEFLDSYDHLRKVRNFIRRTENQGCSVKILNYSRHRNDLIASFEAMLNLPESVLRQPQIGQINRSMTAGEIALQMAFNRNMGARVGYLVSDPLCEKLPEIRSERPRATPAALNTFLERMKFLINEYGFDERYGEAEKYHLPTIEDAAAKFSSPDQKPVFRFGVDQLEVLVCSLSDAIEQKESKKLR